MARRIDGDATAAAVMMAGSATFLVAGNMPVAWVFVQRDPRRRLAMLQAKPVQWKAEQLLFAAGTVVMPVGVVGLARHWDTGSKRRSQEPLAGQRLAQTAALALAAGAPLFLGHLQARYRDPEAFASWKLPMWPFHAYMWLNLAGMAALGGALLARSRARKSDTGILPPDPRWPGWLNVGGAAVFAGILVITGDIPPLMVYAVELATGAALIRQLRRGANRETPA